MLCRIPLQLLLLLQLFLDLLRKPSRRVHLIQLCQRLVEKVISLLGGPT